ncbi:tetratricopeptide repeat protein [Amycolatopsis jiangsuensis]|uniref:Tetratricopeptide (TPR) repeat protein n=1 Tax=Amycolatopsis jiangsuensis TaxID=1181879 RepID=A0A840IRF4_9PSEU|nr:tetratricopeptide repeat protein [Amycolatopsis jiangsuensis]MBB4683957.1 tetratricopeptide (TPR) repeat protein [Amycolatopsis jiangsuensis]
MADTRLQAVRRQLDYKAEEVIRMLLRRADELGTPVMSAASLKVKLSRWENGHEAVSQPYRRLFREVYGRTNDELGFPPEETDDEAEELVSRLTLARSVDAETVEIFRRQVDQARHVDRRLGGVPLLDQLRGNIDQLQGLLGFSTMRGQREALAGVLTEASALAGWEALDRNATRQSWEHHETAKSAAREAGSQILLAHSIAQQAFILIDLGEAEMAVEQLAEARRIAEHSAPPLLRSWMAAAHGEGLSAAGQRDNALRAFDAADVLLPTDPVDPSLPFLFLGGAHLDRWRGHALSKLGESDAIQQLNDALPRLPMDFIRAKTGMLVDLAIAYAAAGDRDAALTHARQARRLAAQIKSDRQLRRLGRLILPSSIPGAA